MYLNSGKNRERNCNIYSRILIFKVNPKQDFYKGKIRFDCSVKNYDLISLMVEGLRERNVYLCVKYSY